MNFGRSARRRYQTLLEIALSEIAINPDRPAVRRREELGPGVRTYHLFHARKQVARELGGVKQPRHLLVFRIASPDIVDIGRVLHDAMDLVEHLPDEYLKPSPSIR